MLSDREQLILQDMLHYMKMIELKKACRMLSVSDKGKKAELIDRILLFIYKGHTKTVPKIPAISCAKNYAAQSLNALSLMLYGGYKNDLKTRNFFKKMVGVHFHFTAFGIDWLNERWLQGNPPTYQEFADYWIQEIAQRKREKPKPKDEWMFIRFMQYMKNVEPQVSKGDLMHAWKELQAQKAKEAYQLVKKAINKLVIKD